MGHFSVPLLGLMCGDLKRDGEKPFRFITEV
jgi:hypothetical protein